MAKAASIVSCAVAFGTVGSEIPTYLTQDMKGGINELVIPVRRRKEIEMKLHAWLALALLAVAEPLAAQMQAPHVCGAGPGPNEVMAGMHPGGNGVAPTPLCYWKSEPQPQTEKQPRQPIQLPPLYAAFVGDPERGMLYWNYFSRTSDEAKTDALAACRENGGRNCEYFGGFNDQCGAVAVSEVGKVFVGFSPNPLDAGRDAMRRCNDAAAATVCTLKALPICSSYDYNSPATSSSERLNDAAAKASQELIEEQSAKLEDREYWGAAFEVPDGELISSVNHQSERGAVQGAMKYALDHGKCADGSCKQRAAANNTCMGLAYKSPSEPGATAVVIDRNPAVAAATARAQCSASHGRCIAMARCSGREYKWGHPGMEPSY